MVTTIGFDADDTLWHNENIFAEVQERFRSILARHHPSEWIHRKLHEVQLRNLPYFGYGAKGLTLSMIETAIELTEGRISGAEVQQLIDWMKDILRGPPLLLEGAQEVVTRLSRSYRLLLITKGDLLEQEVKVARSGLAGLFHGIEILSDKTPAAYSRILQRHGVRPQDFLMVGNSLRSDILPVVEVGGRAVHVPYRLTWAHEVVDATGLEHRFEELGHLGELEDYLQGLSRAATRG